MCSDLIPNRIELEYFDKYGRSTTKENAVTVIVIEYDKDNNIINKLMSAIEQTPSASKTS